MAEDLKNLNQADFEALVEKYSTIGIKEGSIVDGTITSVTNNFITVDVGLKSEGKIALKDLSYEDREKVAVGGKMSVYIVSYEDQNGDLVVSREKALKEVIWDELEKLFDEKAKITGVITGKLKGGFAVDLKGTVAFLPLSQVDFKPVRDIRPLLGLAQPFKILKLDKDKGNIVVSRKAIMEEIDAEEKEKLLASLQEGMVVDGIVKNITNYGAFVDIGGIDGLLHSSDISWQKISHPSEVLEIGQKIQVKIIKFANQKISLGMKQLQPDPWNDVDINIKVGDIIDGTVTKVNDFGVFVQIKPGIDGLVYQSDLSWKRNANPYTCVNVGDPIQVKVLEVNLEKKKIALGRKQLLPNPLEKAKADFPVGTVIKGAVTNITGFGIFINLFDDVDGMCHINDIAWGRPSKNVLSNYKKGDIVEAKVLEVDVENEKVSLGIKQLTNDPHAEALQTVNKGDVVTVVVKKIEDDMLYVELQNGLPGIIKKSEIAKDKRDKRLTRFAIGDSVDAKITHIDRDAPLITLSVKELEIDEEKRAMAEYGSTSSGASLGDILGDLMNKNNSEN